MVEPLGGASPWQEYLDDFGEGLIGISVPVASAAEADQARRQFADEGIDILASASVGDSVDWFLLDSQDAFKCLIASGVGTSYELVTPTRTYP